jgi:hypothetical protein
VSVSPFVEALQDAAFAVYSGAYGRIRARYGWDDAPIAYRAAGRRQYIGETVPPKHLSGEAYSPYYRDVSALHDVYATALDIAHELGKKRLPRLDGYDGDVRELLEYNLRLRMEELRKAR